MHYFVTGARGFVMSVLIKELLDPPENTVTAVDLHPPDDTLTSYLDQTQQRVRFTRCDVTDAEAIARLVTLNRPDVLVHGATITHDPVTERRDPSSFMRVNVQGTSSVLDAARRANLRRVLLISSGAVYGCSPQPVLTEDSTPMPDEMYGISKLASELIAHRYSQLYGIQIPIARLTKMFGPMERPSTGRAVMSLPYHLAQAATHHRSLTLTPRTMQAGGDWLSAIDAAKALHLLTTTDTDGSHIYNVASGIRTGVRQLIDAFGVDVVQGAAAGADMDMDPGEEFGKNGIYNSDRAQNELAWKPRSLRQQVEEYLDWAGQHTAMFDATP